MILPSGFRQLRHAAAMLPLCIMRYLSFRYDTPLYADDAAYLRYALISPFSAFYSLHLLLIGWHGGVRRLKHATLACRCQLSIADFSARLGCR